MRTLVKTKKLHILIFWLCLIVVGVIIAISYTDFKKKNELIRQEIVQSEKEAEMIRQQRERKQKLIASGIKAIIHTKVLMIEKDGLVVQEIYPYKDISGKTYPIQTLTLSLSSTTKYFKRNYGTNSEGITTTEFKDEEGVLNDIKPDMFVSAMIKDNPYGSKKIDTATIVYFEHFPGVKYVSEEKNNPNDTAK